MCPYRREVIPLTHPLDLHEFFDHYEALSHQIAGINELQRRINEIDPTLLQSDSEWFVTWSQDGKRKLPLRRHSELDRL